MLKLSNSILFGFCFFVGCYNYMYVDIFRTIELNIFALLILLIILLSEKKKISRKGLDLSDSSYLGMVLMTLLMLILDITMYSLDGKTFAGARGLIVFFRSWNFALTPVVGYLWSIYVASSVIHRDKTLQIYRDGNFIILFIYFFFVLSDLTKHNIYSIDDLNKYHRGELFLVPLSLTYFYMISAFILAIKNKTKIKKEDFNYLIFFPICPFICGVIQFLLPGISIIWASVTVSMLMIFVNIQNNKISLDYLTGLKNKRALSDYLDTIQKTASDELFGGIMIDVDKFKQINDTYGHNEGDRALETIANILENSFRSGDFVARYAGDEFIAIVKIKSPDELPLMIDRVNGNLRIFNSSKELEYPISLSMGCGVFEKNETISSFIEKIDECMYIEKNKKPE